MLVGTEELAQHLDDPNWIVFDCRHDLTDHGRGARLYQEGHIPNAYFASVEGDLSGSKNGTNGRHPLPKPEAFASFLARCGVSPESTIVAYDDAGGLYAARLWWLARSIGLQRVALLDGGVTKWIADGKPLTQAGPAPRARSSPLPAMSASMPTATATDVFARLNDSAFRVVDARAAERYRGDVEPIDRVGGHIPGAVNRFYKLNLNPDLTFRKPENLRHEFRELLGAVAAENVAHQCGSGITACANLFAMEYAGLNGSALYAGSWSEWISDPSRPIAKGSAA